ncbi:hypothetical protein FB567DRAFT_433781 [Paraphoma chrysanthemicola]|uniref:Nagb/rpia/CoA transferase-like protein n=1 Tax=Paraphoma chrysanthemicola TaxID=798071 RepID=A0A8K0RE19_9PLEO|nr:hypothetical protein FB567DRAFT_433781 [Paraphoma chrysanthemicola]
MKHDLLVEVLVRILPPSVPLPQIKNTTFAFLLRDATQELRIDFKSGAAQLADVALGHFAPVTDAAVTLASSRDELWALLIYGAKQLSIARPSMGAAVTARLLRMLKLIAESWAADTVGPTDKAKAARLANKVVEQFNSERKSISQSLSAKFVSWLQMDYLPQHIECSSSLRILTLSNSSSIRQALVRTLCDFPSMRVHLTVLESRPRCEGADMAAHFSMTPFSNPRLAITVVPDCAVATAARNIDMVLLGADRISFKGDVSNKIGSLAATMCAKQQSKSAKIVVLSDSDKIAMPGGDMENHEIHPPSELSAAWSEETRRTLEGTANVEVFGEWFEWVPAGLVDVYVTEKGRLAVEDVVALANEVKTLDETIFQTQGE